MDNHLAPFDRNDDWGQRFSRALNDHRSHIKQFVEFHLRRIGEWEADLASQVEQVAEQLRAGQDTLSHSHDQASELNEQAAQLDHRAAELAARAEALESREAQFLADHQRFQAEQAELEQLLHQAAEAQQPAAETAELQARLEAALAQVAELTEQLAESEAQRSGLEQTSNAAFEDAAGRAEELAARNAELEAAVADLSAQLEAAGCGSSLGESQELDDLRRRHEMALDDIRDLRKQNAELQRRLQASGNSSGDDAHAMDWESQKRRLLAMLEAESADEAASDGARREELLTIEGTIRITDSIVQERDREIAQLERLLEEQSSNVGSVSVGAAAIGAMLDNDEIIQQERQRLAQLQREWEAKLRQAEIDLSVERAKLARERAELADKQRDWEGELAQRLEPEPEAVTGEPSKDKKSNRGRWLSRLGLGDGE